MIKNEALKQLNARRNKELTRAYSDYQKALNNESFYQTEKKIRELQYQLALSNSEKERQELKELKQQREKILASLNLSPDPIFECKKCLDTGYIKGKMCSCLNKRIIKQTMLDMGITEDLYKTFDSSCIEIFPEKDRLKVESIYSKMKEFCDKFPSRYINLTFSGKTGTGKTFLSGVIAGDLSLKGFLVMYTTAAALNNNFLKIHTADTFDKTPLLKPFLECDLLIIDDLGTEVMYNNVTLEYLYMIFSERNLKSLSTLITTNLSNPQILARYGERIFSRLNDKKRSLFITFGESDLRTGK